MTLPALVSLADLTLGIYPDFSWLTSLVETATGWFGLAIIFAYSFLIAFALPGVSEIVLFAPLNLGLPYNVKLALIIVVSGAGKAAGSVFAFHIGHETKESGYVEKALARLPVDVMGWTERKAIHIAQKWGYAGLAAALCVPGFPDTLSIYAFAVLEDDYLKFAAATFVGSAGRLIVTLVGIEAAVAFL
ncbi:hypothetical protein GJR96_01265 [Haloferax sp. MBLA0076]|uniref:Uncharacterized protein n=1 Tax=Haloferax litoreum TaxID=2666140 RepID=A0A6A8GFM3_9EURY|nr:MULTISPECIES: hypothetical protein [Haloferax]KAB1192142.1 hypothetical protein Hfx1148_01265 [Haloferax sp. CBA1148]MRX20590.1 hypothetical protein [Haloferax litoreum]